MASHKPTARVAPYVVQTRQAGRLPERTELTREEERLWEIIEEPYSPWVMPKQWPLCLETSTQYHGQMKLTLTRRAAIQMRVRYENSHENRMTMSTDLWPEHITSYEAILRYAADLMVNAQFIKFEDGNRIYHTMEEYSTGIVLQYDASQLEQLTERVGPNAVPMNSLFTSHLAEITLVDIRSLDGSFSLEDVHPIPDRLFGQ